MRDEYTQASELAREICGCAGVKQHKRDIALIRALIARAKADAWREAAGVAKVAEPSMEVLIGQNPIGRAISATREAAATAILALIPEENHDQG
jgi:hypothetical protein